MLCLGLIRLDRRHRVAARAALGPPTVTGLIRLEIPRLAGCVQEDSWRNPDARPLITRGRRGVGPANRRLQPSRRLSCGITSPERAGAPPRRSWWRKAGDGNARLWRERIRSADACCCRGHAGPCCIDRKPSAGLPCPTPQEPAAIGYVIVLLLDAALGALPLILWRSIGRSIAFGATIPGQGYSTATVFMGEVLTTCALGTTLCVFLAFRSLRRYTPFFA